MSRRALDLRGQWVLVTGASSGLGREIARQLARDHGAHIVAIARRRDALEALKAEVERGGRSRVEVLCADLSRIEEVDRVLDDALRGRKLRGAVLNAGVTYFGPHSALEWEDFEKMLQTNIVSGVRMANRLVPELDGGGLLLVSSMAALIPVPYQSAYSATKAFLLNFGCGLSAELQGTGVSVTVFAPGGVVTEMTAGEKFAPLRSWLMPVDRAAREAIRGFVRRRVLVVPGLVNRLGALLAGFLPRSFLASRLASTYRRALEVSNGHSNEQS